MRKTSFKIGLPITIFKEGKSYVAYSPALDLSTSASTYEKAQSRFLDATKLFRHNIQLSWLFTPHFCLSELLFQQGK